MSLFHNNMKGRLASSIGHVTKNSISTYFKFSGARNEEKPLLRVQVSSMHYVIKLRREVLIALQKETLNTLLYYLIS
jgi:hypothetical protein